MFSDYFFYILVILHSHRLINFYSLIPQNWRIDDMKQGKFVILVFKLTYLEN